jgi:hypothetical protein
MAIPFSCPHCGRRTDVDEKFAGQTGPCSDCGLPITIPELHVVKPVQRQRQRIDRENIGLVITTATALLATALVAILGVYRYLPELLGQQTPATKLAACRNQLHDIALALQAYEADHGSLPPAVVTDAQGRPMHSWRILLLPYLGADARSIYAQYRMNEPWDSPTNLMAAAQTPSAYRCPADTSIVTAETSYVLVTGPGTLYDGLQPASTDRAAAGDGDDQTILVVEAHGAGIGWAEPRDLDIVQLARGVNATTQRAVRSGHVRCAMAVTVDGTVLQLPDTMSGTELRGLATAEGGEVLTNFARWKAD